MDDSNMQYVTSTSFLLVTYAKYLTSSHKVVNCGGAVVTPKRLRTIAKKQVYIYIFFFYNIYYLLRIFWFCYIILYDY